MDPLTPRRFLTRRKVLKLALAGTAGCLIDAYAIEPEILTVTHRDIRCAALPPAWNGLKVGLLADFHFKPGKDDELLDKVIHRVAREKPDIIALAGDYMSYRPDVIGPLLVGLGKLTAKHGVFAVMGNHDGWNVERAVIRRQFEAAGISFLINQHSVLTVEREPLAVAGTDWIWGGKPDPVKTFAGLKREIPVLALVHEPDYFDQLLNHRELMLQVSGHTHGGQCRVPLIGYAPAKVRFGKKYVYGAFSKGRSNLFVTRGVGTTGARVRFACPPELAILRLVSTPAIG